MKRFSIGCLCSLAITAHALFGCFYSPEIVEETPEQEAPPIIQRAEVEPSLIGTTLVRETSEATQATFRVEAIEDANVEDALKVRWIYGDTLFFTSDYIPSTGSVRRPGVSLTVDLCYFPYDRIQVDETSTLTFAVTDGDWLDEAGGGASQTPEELLRVTEGSYIDFVQWTLEFKTPCTE